MLIRLFTQLHATHGWQDVELVVVGAGEDEPTARLLAAPHSAVHLLGALPPDRVAALMRVADLVVVPSLLYENAPQVIVEALALQRPVSVSDSGGAPELVRAVPNTGFVVAPTEDAWRAHLAWAAEHRAEIITRRPTLPHEDMIATFEKLYATPAHHHPSER